MKIFDMHCDTVTTAMSKKQNLYKNNLHIDFERLSQFEKAYQVFAIWLEDKYYTNAFNETKRAIDFFNEQYAEIKDKCPSVTPILSVEGGEAIENDIGNIKKLKSMGICLITLCWNFKNNIGCGALSGYNDGLTPFGIEAIKEMESLSIIPDVSHLNEKGFCDLCENTKMPFLATHSNAYSIHPHPRNLKDHQIKKISERGGLIGINIYNDFVGNEYCTSSNILPHIKHIINTGGKDVIALGCDFDGIDKHPQDIANISDIPYFYEKVANNFGYETADKMFFENAYNFFRQYL